MNIESRRLAAADSREKDWKFWGPYLSERAWGTVREDYSADGNAWDYFPFEDSHVRAFRWSEDGIGGICDRHQHACFSLSFWNTKDPILKERLFGLSGPQGNHGEDVKEYYYYLDATPTNSYLKYLYKYPQNEFPYKDLLETNKNRTADDPEYELIDTGIFNSNEYFDVTIEYAKADFADICIRITATNHGENLAPLHLLPTLWFRNRWSWSDKGTKPKLEIEETNKAGLSSILMTEEKLGKYRLVFSDDGEAIFTENETNFEKLFGAENIGRTKDAFGDYIINGDTTVVSRTEGTKSAAHFVFHIPAHESRTIYLRLFHEETVADHSYSNDHEFENISDTIFEERIAEANEFYNELIPKNLDADSKMIMRQSLSGMIWTKQFYNYVVREWLAGDPAYPPPPAQRLTGRNVHWTNVYADDVISMPDKWEYPWFAAWDLAFHCVPLAMLDPVFAKRQLLLLLREWYMHPAGQIPAYEWAFDDVNPPVHAWAALEIFRIEKEQKGYGDRDFLVKVFHKLLLNFTWWVNRKDSEGDNVFEGGFLGLDNIGIFDRSKPLPTGGHIEQSDGTSWMAMYCLNMLSIALELAQEDRVYEDVASKFFEHFVYISDAMNNLGNQNTELWNERDGFYYDVLQLSESENIPLKIRSMVGLIPLFAVATIENELLAKLPDFRRRTKWFIDNRPDLTKHISYLRKDESSDLRLISLVNPERLRKVLSYMLSESEFLSEYGIRALSRYHLQHPYYLKVGEAEYKVKYEPGESRSNMFGGNSNWRGPIWFPVNYLIIESLRKFNSYFGDDFKVEFPTGSENKINLGETANELEHRLISIFKRNDDGLRPVFGKSEKFQNDKNFRDYPLFYEYFHGDNGCGLGASHQTGWTGLIGRMLDQISEDESK